MKIHVLPGDALVETFKKTNIEGAIVVCRECLIEGDIEAENLQEFWNVRAKFIKDAYSEDENKYFEEVVSEFEKLNNLTPEVEINLWFEYELFCQVNMWFCLHLLEESKATVYRVAPTVRTENEVWKGFGSLNNEDLQMCYEHRIKFSQKDIRLGANLWDGYQRADFKKLEELSETKSICFSYLKEICRAEIQKSSRPKEVQTWIRTFIFRYCPTEFNS